MTELTLQLYSARNTDLDTALAITAAAGYKSVEAYGENLTDPEAFKSALQAHGLTMASAHVGIDQLESHLQFNMDLLSGLGASHMVCPYLLPERRPTDSAGWIQLAHMLGGVNDKLSNNGFTFAYHNHDFEFETLADGGVPMQLLLENAPGMHWEIDIGWVVRAGLDPSDWLKNYANRISAVHLKDVANKGESLDEDGWADVGHGIINWSPLVSDIKSTAAQYFIVEHDNPADLTRFATNSINAIQGWKW